MYVHGLSSVQGLTLNVAVVLRVCGSNPAHSANDEKTHHDRNAFGLDTDWLNHMTCDA